MGKKFLTLMFVVFMLASSLVYEASAQTRGEVRVVRRPVVVRQYVYRDPLWASRYYGNPYYNYGYSGFYDPYYYQTPYQRFLEQRFYLQRELAGNRRELAEHTRKYRADGVITPKERRELNDDIKDVRNSEAKLRYFSRNY
ncbi:MAG: hypothetical protein LC730_04780 [Acidobacteria bacterium]|nr:hypothetical protein [Acidobacteriota bacterium]MCA1608759.1 hypothetical protein [Acidobacteriota bacterium]